MRLIFVSKFFSTKLGGFEISDRRGGVQQNCSCVRIFCNLLFIGGYAACGLDT